MRKVKKPWGNFVNLWQKGLNIKVIELNSGSRLSLQSHKLRDEAWFLLSGNLDCQIGEKEFRMKKGIPYLILRGVKHRLSASQKAGKIIEISFGKFDEKDVIRYEDDYGRVGEA
jgi:mannose-6-phosphate isomerase-like protein (cupin superfamily)